MSDLISRRAAINAIHEIEHIDCEGWELIDDIEECLKQLPTVEEQKKGKMTNREYLDSLSNMDFANFIYSKLLKIGKEYNDSVSGIAHWLGLEKSKEKTTCETCVYRYDLYMNGGCFICIRKGAPFSSKRIANETHCDKWEGKE